MPPAALNAVKSRLKTTQAYQWLLRRRGAKEDEAYSDLCRRSTEALDQSSNWEEISRRLLSAGWSGPKTRRTRASEVRVFVVDLPAIGGPWFEEELAREFRTTVFSISRHMRGYLEGRRNLVDYSCGVFPEDYNKAFPGVSDPAWKLAFQRDLLASYTRARQEGSFDLCLVYGTNAYLDRETLQSLRADGTPVALMCLDDKHAHDSIKPLLGSYDIHLTNSLECIPWYLAKKQASYWYPQGIDTSYFAPKTRSRDIQVSFVGIRYGARLDFIDQLRREGVEVECFGPGWPNGVVDDQRDIYARSWVNLGVGYTGFSYRSTCVKGRDFEIPATANLYLTTYNFELADLFSIGSEILCYHDPMDCASQVRRLLADPERIEAIGRAGRERCVRDHTWTARMNGLLKFMGILG